MRGQRSSPSSSSSSTATIGFLSYCHIHFLLLLSWSSNKVHGNSDVLRQGQGRHAVGSPLLSSKRIADSSSSSYGILTPTRRSSYTTRRRWLPNIIDDNGDREVTKSVDDFDILDDVLGYRLLNRLDRHSGSSSSSSSDGSNNRSHMQRRLTKTGTTIVGVTSRHGVVLAADARATMGASTGMIVADASCVKLHPLSTTTWMAGAGSAADLQHVAKLMRTQAKLYAVRYSTESRSTSSSSNGSYCSAGIGNPDTIRINANDDSSASSTTTQRPAISASSVDVPSVHTICRWIQSHLVTSSCNLYVIVGGWDAANNRPVLRAIQAQGSMDVVDYTALGSGSLAALSVLESSSLPHRNGNNNNNNLSIDDAVALAVRAVQAGIDNDLGSGSHVDVCIIQRPGTTSTTGSATAATTRYIQRYTSPEQLPPVLLNDHGDDDDATGNTTFHRGRQGSTDRAKHGKEMSDAARGTPRSHFGVNGFGNRPYTIQSQRVLRSSSSSTNDDAANSWSDLVR